MAAAAGRPAKRCITGATPMQASRKSANRTVDVYDVLPPDPAMRRPVANSGRTMLVEDAVFEVIAQPAPRREFNDNPKPRRQPKAGIDPARLAAIGGVFVINRLEQVLARLSPQAFTTLLASLFFIVFWAFGGFGALATEPVVAASKPFSVEQVFIEEQDANGMKLLSVGGRLFNRTSETLDVPVLTVASESGSIIGTIQPAARQIEAGTSVPFSARLKLAGGKSGEISIFPQM